MLKVIISDDELHICRLLEALIDWEAEGFSIEGIAGDGHEAARMCISSQPDLLITDIRMPGLDGLELVQLLHEQMPSTQVIIITGYSEFQYAHQALRYGVVDYLLKPIRANELLAALSNVKEKIYHSAAVEIQKSENQLSLKSMQTIKENLLYSLLAGDDSSSASLSKRGLSEDCHVEFSGKIWRLVQLEAILGTNENMSVEDYLGNKMKEIFTEEYKNENLELIFSHNSRGYFCLVNGDECGFRDFLPHLQTIKFIILQILELFKGSFTIGISNECTKFSQLNNAVKECETAIEHKIIVGKNQIIAYSDIPIQEQKVEDFLTDALEQKFRAAITDADHVSVTNCISELTSSLNLMSRKLSGTFIIQVYEKLTALFFSTISVYGSEEYGNYSEEQLVVQGKCFYNVITAFQYLGNSFRTIMAALLEIKGEQSTRPIRMAQSYIDEHYMEEIQLNDVAKYVGLAPSYLSSLFKKQVGKSLVEYLTHIRIQNAKQLLLDRERNITDIADEVGFADVKYFIKRFKKVTGLTPNEYRKLFGNG